METPLKSPRVSVGISCFNASNSILRAIESARRQIWSNLEIVVVDDGSTDASPTLIQEAAHADPRVVPVLLRQNRGVSTVRNIISQVSSGEFVVFFDDDDTSDPQRVRRQVQAIVLHERNHVECNGLVACNASLTVTRQNGRVEKRTALGSSIFPKAARQSVVLDHALRFLGDARGERLQGTGSLLLRRSTVERLGGFDKSLRRCEDVDLMIRLVNAGGCVIGIPDRLVHQFVSTSTDKSAAQAMESRLSLTRKHRGLLSETRDVRCVELWISMLYTALDRRFVKATYQLLLSLLCCPRSTGKRLRRQFVPRVLVRLRGLRKNN